MSTTHKTAAWHRDLLVNAVRFAAASTADQRLATPAILNPLDHLLEVLLDSWEHALAFEANTGDRVLNDVERIDLEKLTRVVRDLSPVTPENSEAALSLVRPIASDILKRHSWEGPLDPRVFPLEGRADRGP
jgi:hypothetical protein